MCFCCSTPLRQRSGRDLPEESECSLRNCFSCCFRSSWLFIGAADDVSLPTASAGTENCAPVIIRAIAIREAVFLILAVFFGPICALHEKFKGRGINLNVKNSKQFYIMSNK